MIINIINKIISVLLHDKFSSTRPLTVTGAYLNSDGSMIFHQMVLDRVENSEFILQNTLINHSGTQIRIPTSREFYASHEMMEDCYNCFNDFVYNGPNNEFLALVNENFNYMEKERWYLLPQAYSIILTPPGSQKTPLPALPQSPQPAIQQREASSSTIVPDPSNIQHDQLIENFKAVKSSLFLFLYVS